MTFSPHTPQSDSGYQYVPIPSKHVPAVLTFLAGLLSPDSGNTGVVAPNDSASSVERNSDWTDEDLLKFSTMGTKTSETVSRILDLLSQTPGKDGARSTRELADALDLDYFVVKAVPAQVSRTLGKHFGSLDSPYWGLWGTTDFVPPRSNEMYFAVTEERADQWQRVRAADATDAVG